MKFIEKYYTIVIIMIPLLNMYMFSEHLTIADMALFILYFFDFITMMLNSKDGWKIRISYPEMMLYITCVAFWCAVSCFSSEWGVFFRNARYLLYLITLLFFTRKYFNSKLGFAAYKFVGLFSTIYLFIQYIFRNLFGIYLLNYLPFLEVSASLIKEIVPVRCKSVFSEPSIYSAYIIGLLVLLMIREQKNWLDKITIVTLSLGLIISASTTGIVCWIALFMLYGVHELMIVRKVSRDKFLLLFLGVLMVGILILAVLRITGMGNYIISRIAEGSSTKARFDGYTMIANFQNKITGNGMLDTNFGYLNGLVRCIYYFGYIGLVSYALLTIGQLLKSNWQYKILVIIFLVLNVGTEIMFGPMLLLYFSFIMANIRKKDRKKGLTILG